MKIGKIGPAIAGAVVAIVAYTVGLPVRTVDALAAAIPAFGGGCGGSIAFDTPINDAITTNTPEYCYGFEVSAGDTITIRMTRRSGNLDPFLKLVRAGNTLVSDDDSGGGGNSLIANFTLTQSGAYAILASAYAGRTTGEFELSLSRSGANQAATAAGLCDGTIAYGQAVSDHLPVPGALCRYAFSGAAGDVIAVAVRRVAGSLDPLIQIADAAGRTLVSGTDFDVDHSNSWITNYRLTQNGSYAVVVQSRAGQGVGPFELNLWNENRCGGDLRPGQIAHAQITDASPACAYTLAVPTVPTTVTLGIQPLTGNLQPILQLHDPSGRLVQESERFVEQRVEQAGTYQVTVSAALGSSGDFRLSRPGLGFMPLGYYSGYYRVAPTGGGKVGVGGGMRFGSPILGKVPDSDKLPVEYSFNGSVGDTVTIFLAHAEGSSLDPDLELLGPDGSQKAYDDDGGGSRNSLIVGYRLETTGKYTIKAGAWGDRSAGQFFLTVWK